MRILIALTLKNQPMPTALVERKLRSKYLGAMSATSNSWSAEGHRTYKENPHT
ncbi:MAG: hypothetical protein HWQ38_02445 [Nostoc sp. NMS7]|uniref:hypothetical protein n=1 Tax=Nostoc sp. NMS7 TaxID=2815391 RepID=UPI0025F1249C|nr:hypothetical protein [Nostoc sp. NMS7]MBN3945399.1 hypothetical protein [Nostoc sp. NMS7]